jgi:hypothetical protein
MPILDILYNVGGKGYSHSIHKVMKVGPHTRGLYIGLRKLMVLTLNIHQMSN